MTRDLTMIRVIGATEFGEFLRGETFITGEQKTVPKRTPAIEKSAAQNVLVDEAQERTERHQVAHELQSATAFEGGSGHGHPQNNSHVAAFRETPHRFFFGVAAMFRLPLRHVR